MNFLNQYLNRKPIINRRILVTDRSAENIFVGKNGEIIFIDFSTVRVGTQFDNWIQFIEDPRIKFSYSEDELIELFFKASNIAEDNKSVFYAASIYTNLLQAIFTYEKNPVLSISYIDKVNNSFQKLTDKKGMLIRINH